MMVEILVIQATIKPLNKMNKKGHCITKDRVWMKNYNQ
jgi:hypothetical protein